MTASVSFVPAATLLICLVNPVAAFPTEIPAAVDCQVETNLFASACFVEISVLKADSSFSFVAILVFIVARAVSSAPFLLLYKSTNSCDFVVSLFFNVAISPIKVSYLVLFSVLK